MCAARSFLEALALSCLIGFGLGACRSDDPPIVVSIADGVVIAPGPNTGDYFERFADLGINRVVLAWTEPDTNVQALQKSATELGLDLIVGLSPAHRPEDEWNRPDSAPADLEAALDRAQSASDVAGLHFDHGPPGLPDPSLAGSLDASLAAARGRFQVPISFSIRSRSLTEEQFRESGFPPPAGTSIADLDRPEKGLEWARAWGELLEERFERVVVHVQSGNAAHLARVAEDVGALKELLGPNIELWATVDPISMTFGNEGDALQPIAKARDRENLREEITLLRARADAVLVRSAELFEPNHFLAPEQSTRSLPPRVTIDGLDQRALDVELSLHRCCLRDGQLVTVYDHRFEPEDGPNRWQEDACWGTGLYTAAASFRLAVTGDKEAEENARMGFEALHQMANTTPLKGEVVRNFMRNGYLQTDPVAEGSDTIKRWRRASDREIYWVGDISVDQLSGWFLGMAVYHELVATEGERKILAEDVAAVLDVMLANDLHAIEYTGEETTHGNLRTQPVLALSFFQVGYRVTGDEKYRREYERLMDEEAMHIQIANILSLYHSFERFGADHFYSSGFYPLIAFETDPERRTMLEPAFEFFNFEKRRHGDAYADTVYAVFHPSSDTGRRAAAELIEYEPDLVSNAAWLRDFDALHEGPFVPISVRPAAEIDFDYVPPGEKGLRGGLEHRFTGFGFLVSYWMARYHGLL